MFPSKISSQDSGYPAGETKSRRCRCPNKISNNWFSSRQSDLQDWCEHFWVDLTNLENKFSKSTKCSYIINFSWLKNCQFFLISKCLSTYSFSLKHNISCTAKWSWEFKNNLSSLASWSLSWRFTDLKSSRKTFDLHVPPKS